MSSLFSSIFFLSPRIRLVFPRLACLTLLVTGVVFAGPGMVPDASAKVREGGRAIEFAGVRDAAGKSVSLRKFSGKLVVLTFGASWCKPCGKELPAYEKLAKSYASNKRLAKKVVFVAVNIDSSIDKGKAFMRKAGIASVVGLYDPKNTTVASYDPPTMPTTFVIKNGVVKHVHTGFRNGDVGKIKNIVDQNL